MRREAGSGRRLASALALLLGWASIADAVTATFTCTAASGTGWTGTGITSNADSDAYSSYTSTTKDYINVTTCTPDVSVPDGSTVTGMQVRIIGCGTGGTSAARQIDATILGMGTCTAKTGFNQVACGAWTDQTQPAGTADTWGCSGSMTVSSSNVNSTSFGAAVRDNNTSANELRQQFVSIILTFTTTSTTTTTTTTLAGAAAPPRRLL